MNVSLTPELEAFVQDKVASGRYGSASEVIRQSLRLLEEEDQTKARRIEALQMEIQKGIDDKKDGRFTALETDDDYAKLATEIKTEGLRRVEQRKKDAKG